MLWLGRPRAWSLFPDTWLKRLLATRSQDQIEEFALGKVQSGASTRGVYPPDERTRTEFEQWRSEQERS